MSAPASSPGGNAPKPMRRRRVVAGAVLVFVLGLVGYGWYAGWARFLFDPQFPVPAFTASPFANTAPEVAYVGSDACQACHQARTASFRKTGMGRSMAEVDPALELALWLK